jgi:hypothetical protein
MLNNPFLDTYYLRRKSLAADDEALYSVHDVSCLSLGFSVVVRIDICISNRKTKPTVFGHGWLH